MSHFETGNQVLLIEDNPGDARLVEILLRESDLSDCIITRRESLLEGLQILGERSDFAAVLLDLSLPDSNGFETLEKLLTKFPDLNVIVLTGYSDKELGVKAVQAGAQDFLVKGAFDADQLSKSLRFSIERNAILSRLEETQRIAHIGNWECDPARSFFDASDEVYRIFGLWPRRINFTYDDLQNPGHPFSIFQNIHSDVLISNTLKKDISLRLPGGAQRFVFIQCNVEKRVEGARFYGVIQDITERKLAEQEMMKSRERYQEIFSQSKDAIYICSLEGKLIDCNQAAEELFNLNKSELLFIENLHSLFHAPERRNEFLLKLKFRKSVRDFELEIERPGGERRICQISANMLEGEEFPGYNAIVRDITERKQTEELIKARDLARQSAQLKEQFIASISHEMRTPMNAIFGMSNLLAQTPLNTEQNDLVRSINQSSEILLGIINDILEIATIQNGKIIFENEPFNLPDLLTNLVNVMQYKAKEKDLFLELSVDDQIPGLLKGDKLRLNQILFNLVGNAIKFTDEGRVKIIVEKLNDFEGGIHLRFAVEDTGIGIPEDKLDSIFESFTRIRKKDRIYEGTGLGLSITKSLIEQQGGKISAVSKLEEGSNFYFDLIFETAAEPENQDEPLPPVLDKDLKFSLLLVEDHKMNQMVARKTLERQWNNIKIAIAENGQEAIEKLQNENFDIILMDVQMPVMDGYEATKFIREKMPAEIARLPILAMTAHAHLAKDAKYKEYGMDDYVLKPFQPEQLFAKIAAYLNKNTNT